MLFLILKESFDSPSVDEGSLGRRIYCIMRSPRRSLPEDRQALLVMTIFYCINAGHLMILSINPYSFASFALMK